VRSGRFTYFQRRRIGICEMQITSLIPSHTSYSDCVSWHWRLLWTPLYLTQFCGQILALVSSAVITAVQTVWCLQKLKWEHFAKVWKYWPLMNSGSAFLALFRSKLLVSDSLTEHFCMSAAETDCEMCYSGVIVCGCVGVTWRVGIVGGYLQMVLTWCLVWLGGD
jgi:hypothetical protein